MVIPLVQQKLNGYYEELLGKVSSYITSEEEIDLIKKAYEYSSEKHAGETRLTGEDYMVHPLNVAIILTDVRADYETICAGLLHDLLEDHEEEYDHLKEEFGETIADLVQGLTKINRLNFEGDNQSVIASNRKILVGLTEDVRIIILKLADRLHNMRTLWAIPEKAQKEKAKETLDILTPIAHRLGIGHLKSELEDLSLRYYKPDIYFSIVEMLNQTKAERDRNVSDMIESVSQILNEKGIEHKIKGRSKSIYSIYKKLDKGKKFSDIYDLLALRVYVETKEECYQALGYIHEVYKPMPRRFKDYIAMPKANMYQSLHTTVFGVHGELFEIQIRTYEMDEIAENGIASHWSYKEKGSNTKASLQNAMEQKLQFFKAIMELQAQDASDDEVVNTLKEDVLNTSVYVFTPNGDVIELAKGSTPIDFAYRVHTNVGNKMVGAIVNGNIVPLDYQLQDNDVVKIKTNQHSKGPSKEWLNIAHTTQAKNKIRSYFNKIDKEEYLKRGEELLKEELRKRKIPFNEFLSTENIDKILQELKYKDMDEVYKNLGNNKLPMGTLMNLIYHEADTKEDIILKKATSHQNITSPNIKNDIIVRGIDQIKVNVAACCKPIPGDPIVGFITKGNGIMVHRLSCPNMKDVEERIIDVSWNSEINKKYPTTILVHTMNQKDVLLKIITKTANSTIMVQSIRTLTTNVDGSTIELIVTVPDVEHLEKFMTDIRSIPDVIDVERVIQ